MTVAKKMLETAKYHFARGDVDLAMRACIEVCKQKNRPGSRLQAAKLILDHERDLQKYENPKPQELIHSYPSSIEVKFVGSGDS